MWELLRKLGLKKIISKGHRSNMPMIPQTLKTSKGTPDLVVSKTENCYCRFYGQIEKMPFKYKVETVTSSGKQG